LILAFKHCQFLVLQELCITVRHLQDHSHDCNVTQDDLELGIQFGQLLLALEVVILQFLLRLWDHEFAVIDVALGVHDERTRGRTDVIGCRNLATRHLHQSTLGGVVGSAFCNLCIVFDHHFVDHVVEQQSCAIKSAESILLALTEVLTTFHQADDVVFY